MEVGGYYDDLLNAIISSIYVLDLSTIHMATMRNIDPSLTPAIDLLKGYQKNEDVYTSDENDPIKFSIGIGPKILVSYYDLTNYYQPFRSSIKYQSSVLVLFLY